MELIFFMRYLFQAAFAFATAISVFLSAPAFLEKKAEETSYYEEQITEQDENLS
jgi:hypothetical protein